MSELPDDDGVPLGDWLRALGHGAPIVFVALRRVPCSNALANANGPHACRPQCGGRSTLTKPQTALREPPLIVSQCSLERSSLTSAVA